MQKATDTNSEFTDPTLGAFLPDLGIVAGLGVIVVSRDGTIRFMNDTMMRWLGGGHVGPTLSLQDLQPQLHRQCMVRTDLEMADGCGFESIDFVLSRKGLSEDIQCSGLKLLPTKPGGDVVLLCWFRSHNHSALSGTDTSAVIKSLISQAPIGILSLDGSWECNFANAEACQLCNVTREDLLRRGWSRLFSHQDAALQRMINEVLNTGVAQVELELDGNDLSRKILQLDVRGSVNEKGGLENAVCALVDVTDRVERQQEIHRLANYDAVTGLFNRLAMKHQLERYLELAKRLRQKVQVLFVDLDGFKNINDLYGHAVGDQVLVQVSERLRLQVRKNDVVSRFGGDEFVVVIPGETPDGVVDSIADKINHALRKPYVVSEMVIHLTASVGISSFIGDERSEHIDTADLRDEMLKQADLAMYSAKNEGKNQFRRFNTDEGEVITLAYTVGQLLPDALANREIFFHYQPIIDAECRRIIGVEALMRWQHEKLGWVNPEVLINVAEANGKIIDLQHYMLERTIDDFEHLLAQLEELRSTLRLSVNICAIQIFDFKYAEHIARRFKESSIPTQQVTLELTEGTLIEDRAEINSNLAYLKEQGFNVAMDDFGTGYSSLSYLTKFPIDIVKLDKSFIRSLTERDHQLALVRGCIQLSHSIDMQVVAEGVETEQEYDTLCDMSCDFTQGYFHSKPMAPESLVQWIRENLPD